MPSGTYGIQPISIRRPAPGLASSLKSQESTSHKILHLPLPCHSGSISAQERETCVKHSLEMCKTCPVHLHLLNEHTLNMSNPPPSS
ncbi:hypothetical protein CDAR_44771 [Caerostris darwini]|uniref:Uncharacterized protein n=1 Tax=Caerostris darwini TaxID=1538125 RepID=A0AAV4STX7_9ARAC|nr:hypothetical protein CDAR_44771 [Caerostris darwini]